MGGNSELLTWKERYNQDRFYSGQPACEGTLREHHKRRLAYHRKALKRGVAEASSRPTMFEYSHTGRTHPRAFSVPLPESAPRTPVTLPDRPSHSREQRYAHS